MPVTAMMRTLALALALGLVADVASAQDWGRMATVSTTMGIGANRLCLGEGSRGDIGCPTYAPSLTTAGDVSISGNVSANKFIGDGSGLTNLSASGDRIVSGTLSMLAISNTGYISLTTAGSNWGYLSSLASYIPVLGAVSVSSTNVSVTLSHYTPQAFTTMAGGGGNFIVSATSSVSASNAGGGTIKMATGSGLVMTISGSNVGIGTTSPAGALDISGATVMSRGAGAGYEVFDRTNNVGASALYRTGNKTFIWDSVNGNQLTIDNPSGNVGIGTTAPVAPLEIFGAGQTTAALADSGAKTASLALNSTNSAVGSGGAVLFGNVQSEAANSIGMAAIKGYLTNGAGNTIGDLTFSTRNVTADTALTERMRILANGNVGIGTAAPQNLLEIGDGVLGTLAGRGLALSNGSGSSPIGVGQSSTARGRMSWLYNATPANSYMAIGDALGTHPLILQDIGGNVGIGTTSPATLLDVNGAITSDVANNYMIKSNAGNYGLYYDSTNTAVSIYAAGNLGLSVKNTGNVGIGTTGPNYLLDVNGTFHAAGNARFDGAVAMNAINNSGTGYYLCDTSGVISYGSSCASSDRRLKQNIVPLHDALTKITQLQGVSFDFKDPAKYGKGHQIGLIAQDVEKIFPQLVNTNPDGLKSITYEKMTAPLIEAVKELKADNDSDKAAIESLRQDFEAYRRAHP